MKFGIADPDHPDIPIGGWAGQVTELEAGDPCFYLVRWNRQTLNSMAAIYRNRCETDGLDMLQMWLAEHDLEADEGGRFDEQYGLICEIEIGRKRGDAPLADLKVKGRGAERQLVDDHRHWFFNWR